MADLPGSVSEFILSFIRRDRAPAYLAVSTDGRLEEWGGEIETYGLSDLVKDKLVEEQVFFLHGLLPADGPPICLPCVKTDFGVAADIHIFRRDARDWVLLLDASAFEYRRRLRQQEANELSLLQERQARSAGQPVGDSLDLGLSRTDSVLSSLLAAIGVIVLERLPDGSFNILNDPPDWFLRLYPQAAARNTTFRTGENLGFLENFLVDAEVFWLSYNGDDRLRSGPWREMEALGTEGWIEATAVLYQGRKILHLEFPAAAAAEKQSLLQAGRRKSLEITARERASQLLERTRDELETRVRERTQELEQLSRKLQLELAERRQAEEALKRSEEQLLQAQKMEAVGKLAAGIAHDFNNLLTVVMGYSEMALSRLDPSGRLFRDVGEIKKSSERAAALTRRLLTFSRKQMLAPRVFDLSAVAINMGELLRQLIGEDVQLIVKCSATEAKVRADPTQVEQVILNLAVNARDAMPHGGVLTIETSHLALNETLTREHLNIPPGPYVVMTVSDTGCGMDKATASRVFEPYFTTKAEGRGSGLGLSTVYGIVTQSGGAIQVESEPGSGSTFTVLLPAAHEDVTLAEPSVLSSEAVRGSEVVLLVEDEEAVRQLVRAILECEGYTVLEARNGTEAVRVAVEYPEPVDLLLTDTVMPGMSAREARQRLTTLHPGMAVLYMSGYSDDIMLGHQLLDGGIPFLQKPFTPEVLLRKVRDVLEERRLRRCGQKGQP